MMFDWILQAAAFFGVSFVVIFVLMILFVAAGAPERARQEEERRKASAAREAAKLQRKKQEDDLVAEKLAGWPFQARVAIDGATGLVAMDAEGRSLRTMLLSWTDEQLHSVDDRVLPMKSIRAVSVYQPTLQKTVTHIEKVPVAVTKSVGGAGTRALVGGALLGGVGAIAGAASGSKLETTVEHHNVERAETVNYLARAKLILELDDLTTPRVALEFVDHIVTNEWHSRLSVAMRRR